MPSALAAGALAWGLSAAGLISLDAPLAPALVAKLTASLLATIAVALAFLYARSRLKVSSALLVAIGFGLGTNMWAGVSQTLWQQETALCAVMAAVALLAHGRLTTARTVLIAACLGLAGAARPQLALTVAVLGISIIARRGVHLTSLLALFPIAAAAGLTVGANLMWFGHPFGAMPQLEALHPAVHATDASFTSNVWTGMAGLLVSPSRGLLVFSPIVVVAIAAWRPAIEEGWSTELRWCTLAALCQLLFYSSYSVWWGGHTFGPRYALDALPSLLPLASAGVAVLAAKRPLVMAAVVALAWSIAVAATGAFVYPADRWNTQPLDVDRHHERLWDWSDPQLIRCWQTGLSPQNFALFSAAAVRPPSTEVQH